MNRSLDLSRAFYWRNFIPPVANLIILYLSVTIAGFVSAQLIFGLYRFAALSLASGVTLGVLLINPKRYWLAYLLTGFGANVTVGLMIGSLLPLVLCLSAANFAEIVLAASLIYRPDRPTHHFTDRASALRMAAGFTLGPALSVLIAGAAKYEFLGTPLIQTVQVWYLAHAIGLAIVTPLTLTVLFKDFAPLLKPIMLVRTIGVIVLFTLAIAAVFAQTQLPTLFVIFPFLALVVFQLGFPGATIGLFILGVSVSFFTLAGSGPFMLMKNASPDQRVLFAQFFILTCVAMALPIAIALSERKRLEGSLLAAQEQLRQLAATDQLTGISNRRMFEDFLAREWKRALREKLSLCAIMIDVDYFKLYNDRYGHQAGDECLKAISTCLVEVVRRPGDLIARYGGEEFIALLPGTTLQGARFVADQIRRRVEALQIVHASTSDGRITLSLGVASTVPSLDSDPHDLIAKADALLYLAKNNGRNCVFDATMPQMMQSAHG